MTQKPRTSLVLIAAMAVAAGAFASPGSADTLEPRQAGARHGQALGVELICKGLRTTPAVSELEAKYQGNDLKAFKEESEKVLLSWQKVPGCVKPGDPNECRLIYDWSCRDAIREIGPEGTKIKGLIEMAH